MSFEKMTMVYWGSLLVMLLLMRPIPTEGITSSACYSLFKCDDMSLSCPDGKIFILTILYGMKPQNACNPHCHCCQPKDLDCVLPYTDLQFGLVFHRCWNVQTCSFSAQMAPQFCTDYDPRLINVADYSCLEADDIIAFHENNTISASAVAVHYDHRNTSNYPVATDGNQTWHCQVDSADCVQRQADVILVKENYTGSMSHCSSIGWNGGNFISCNELFLHDSFNATTPFLISLQVNGQYRSPSGWAVIRAQIDTILKVTCGYTSPMTASHCPGTTDNQPTAVTLTSYGSSSGSIWSSTPSTSTVPAVTTASTSQVSASMEMTSYSTSVTDGQSESPSGASSSLGPIVGGAVAAILVLVAAVLGVFCYVKRCQQRPDSDSKPASFRMSSMHLPLTSLSSGNPPTAGGAESAAPINHDDNDGDHDRFGRSPKSQCSHPTTLDIHGNQKSPAEDPDYDLLGQKKPQSSSSNPAATYGRLGEVGGGGEDTDYSYDHLARGRQAAPDVINSDYDTAALHVTSEGDYDVAGIPRKQQVITGSDYDAAQILTSECDYNRVDFQGKKQHVITGSDYDTAEIVASAGDYNRVDFQGKKQHVITGSDYDTAEIVTSEGDYNKVDFRGRKQKFVTGSATPLK